MSWSALSRPTSTHLNQPEAPPTAFDFASNRLGIGRKTFVGTRAAPPAGPLLSRPIRTFWAINGIQILARDM
jgi:hypothetical protein